MAVSFGFLRASAIDAAIYFAVHIKDQKSFGVSLDPFGHSSVSRRFVTFASRCLDFDAAVGDGRLGFSKGLHSGLSGPQGVSSFTDLPRDLADMPTIGAATAAPNMDMGKSLGKRGHLSAQFRGVAVLKVT
jgi:hypothetical protein